VAKNDWYEASERKETRVLLTLKEDVIAEASRNGKEARQEKASFSGVQTKRNAKKV